MRKLAVSVLAVLLAASHASAQDYKPVDVPTEHIPTRRDAARAKFAQLLDEVSSNT